MSGQVSTRLEREKTDGADGANAPAVETAGVEFEEVEFDERLEDTALYKHTSATVEALYRQNGRFFLQKEYYADWGEDASVEDCEWIDCECDPLSAAEAELWLEHNCGERDEVALKVAELDRKDGVGK